jgi:hypothetical protein
MYIDPKIRDAKVVKNRHHDWSRFFVPPTVLSRNTSLHETKTNDWYQPRMYVRRTATRLALDHGGVGVFRAVYGVYNRGCSTCASHVEWVVITTVSNSYGDAEKQWLRPQQICVSVCVRAALRMGFHIFIIHLLLLLLLLLLLILV